MGAGPMRQQQMSLSELRREVDAIDDAIHDLLVTRANLSQEIGQHPERTTDETGLPLARPARKAEILRRILGRPEKGVPSRSLIRIWCEILASGPGEHGTLHVFAGDHAVHYQDLARTYFGSLMAMVSHASATAAVHACADNPRSVGIVPLADSGGEGAGWWTHLAPAGVAGPRVVARIPFVRDDGGNQTFPQAFAIAALEQEETGDDTTLLVLETEGEISRQRLQSFLYEAGFRARILAAGGGSGRGPNHLLLASRGFVGLEDPRLAVFLDKAGDEILRVAPVGGYANPIDGPGQDESP